MEAQGSRSKGTQLQLYLEIENGPMAGQKFELRLGVVIGRKSGDIIVKDSKMSGEHARVIEQLAGQLTLVDDESVNGIVFENQRVRVLNLTLGVRFRLGNTQFRVVDGGPSESIVVPSMIKKLAAELDPSKELPTQNAPKLGPFTRVEPLKPLAPVAKVSPLRPKSPPKTVPALWPDALQQEIPRLIATNPTPTEHFAAFRRALRLEFVQGVQSERVVLLGYGPRYFGAESLDIELQDPEAPGLAFEILPEGNEARFINHDPSMVRLGGRAVSSDYLKNGDQITVGQTIIEIRFV
jgi:hypothetical protein